MGSEDKNYSLGQAFFEEGQLDWAYDKFRACTLNHSLMETLYTLAQEYENKQEFKSAVSVYQYMGSFDAKFRNLKTRKRNAEQQIMATLQAPTLSQIKSRKLKQTKLPRSTLGHFQLEKEIGKGATGTIYLAHDLRTGHKVAVKTLPLVEEFDKSDVIAVKQRFFREAETVRHLHHPNIVTIFDTGEEDGLAYIAMELLTGQDLTHYARKGYLLSPVMVMGIVYRAARALHYAHSKKVIHRDIKPANIMFDSIRKKIILTDFGIARLIDASRTRSGIILGTPAYMSPEQLADAEIDGQSDLFALGVMLFHLLTGELPFRGESIAMLMYLIANEPHRDIFQLRPDLVQPFPALAAIIDKALEKEPVDRFKNGFEMAESLKQCAKK